MMSRAASKFTSRPALLAAAGLLAALGLWQTGSGVYIHAKAMLAQALLQRAWERTMAGEEQVRPWPWADTWPVARLEAPGHNADMIVLDGASGRTLAFGPGQSHGFAPIGTPGPALISAHRDTHFSFLRDIAAGDILRLHTADGTIHAYRVAGTEIVDHRDATIPDDPFSSTVTLVTCYPFDALAAGGPLRFLVHAVAENGTVSEI